MKKLVYIILVTALMASVSTGCSNRIERITAVETVQKFFDNWNEKDEEGLYSLMYKRYPTGTWQLDLLNSVELKSCVEREDIDKSDWYEPWYPDPYDFTRVDTIFVVDSKEGSVLITGEHAWWFWLVKESKNADWIIVSYGMG